MSAPVRPRCRSRRPVAGTAALLALAALAACNTPEPAVVRGDRLWADSSYTDALAEYRLALVQAGPDPEILLRVAHAYAATGQLERARESYDDLLARAPEYTDQAVYDFLGLAYRARQDGDRFGMAGGIEAALELRSELPVGDFAAPLARYYIEMGDPARALEFYQRALTSTPGDSTAELLYRIGLIYEQQERCREAFSYFTAYRQRAPLGARVPDAEWRSGNCAFTLARQAHRDGALGEALDYLSTVLDLGVPANIQDQAWFDRGEILFAIGRFDEALAAYQRVLALNPSRGGLLVERARERVDQIRFGS